MIRWFRKQLRRLRSPVWTTKDRRRVRVADMSDAHLINCLRAIDEGRLCPVDIVYRDGLVDFDTLVCEARITNAQLAARNRWKRVFEGELAARGIASQS